MIVGRTRVQNAFSVASRTWLGGVRRFHTAGTRTSSSPSRDCASACGTGAALLPDRSLSSAVLHVQCGTSHQLRSMRHWPPTAAQRSAAPRRDSLTNSSAAAVTAQSNRSCPQLAAITVGTARRKDGLVGCCRRSVHCDHPNVGRTVTTQGAWALDLVRAVDEQDERRKEVDALPCRAVTEPLLTSKAVEVAD